METNETSTVVQEFSGEAGLLRILWAVVLGTIFSLMVTIGTVCVIAWDMPQNIPPSAEVMNGMLPQLKEFAIGWEKDRFVYLYSLLVFPVVLLGGTWIIYRGFNLKNIQITASYAVG